VASRDWVGGGAYSGWLAVVSDEEDAAGGATVDVRDSLLNLSDSKVAR
jgi:hypothetical protein